MLKLTDTSEVRTAASNIIALMMEAEDSKLQLITLFTQ
jgi:hypothetical protein